MKPFHGLTFFIKPAARLRFGDFRPELVLTRRGEVEQSLREGSKRFYEGKPEAVTFFLKAIARLRFGDFCR